MRLKENALPKKWQKKRSVRPRLQPKPLLRKKVRREAAVRTMQARAHKVIVVVVVDRGDKQPQLIRMHQSRIRDREIARIRLTRTRLMWTSMRGEMRAVGLRYHTLLASRRLESLREMSEEM